MNKIIKNKVFIKLVITFLLCNINVPCKEESDFKIVIQPSFDTITIKTRQITLDDMEAEVYKNINDWNIRPIKGSRYNIKYTMHQGSGKYWTIGIVDSATGKSAFYFNTTTIGIRNVYQYIDGALPWVNDFNNDGNDEIIIWGSYLAFESGTNGDYGLIGWVYEKKANDTFVINFDYSSQIWEKIIMSYKKNRKNPLEGLLAYGNDTSLSKIYNFNDNRAGVLIKSLEIKINEVKSEKENTSD